MKEQAQLSICDPKVTAETIKRDLDGFSNYEIQTDPYKAAQNAHAIVILTEWEIFKNLDYKRLYEDMQKPAFVFDGRNIVNLQQLRSLGFEAYGVGKPIAG